MKVCFNNHIWSGYSKSSACYLDKTFKNIYLGVSSEVQLKMVYNNPKAFLKIIRKIDEETT